MLSQQQLCATVCIFFTVVAAFLLFFRSNKSVSKKRRRDGTIKQALALLPAQHALQQSMLLQPAEPGALTGWWVRPRSGHFWQVEVLQYWEDKDFRSQYRVPKWVPSLFRASASLCAVPFRL